VSLARTHMRHPMNIRAESSYEQATVPATAQFIYQVHDLDKPEMIARILQAENSGKTIVFTRTKRQAQRVAEDMTERGFDASPLHGDMQQVSREKAMTRFRDGKLKLLVATDVAARGIDVESVTHVINYSCPEDDKTYLHRIGRTGRAGNSGIAVTFVDWADVTRWKVINKALDLPFEEVTETYSTSEHFFHDMGIAPGTNGRIKPPAPASERPSRARGPRDESGPSRSRSERSRSGRNRSRTRGGEPVGADAAAGAGPGKGSGEQSSAGGEGAPKRRNRRRRRGSASNPATTN
ncbi:MAG: helicase-related protein, partial [Nocardioidaceae bacterium]